MLELVSKGFKQIDQAPDICSVTRPIQVIKTLNTPIGIMQNVTVFAMMRIDEKDNQYHVVMFDEQKAAVSPVLTEIDVRKKLTEFFAVMNQ